MLKRITVIVIILALLTSLAACGGSATTTTNTTTQAPGSTTVTSSANTTPGASSATTAAPLSESYKIGAFLQLTGGNSAYGIEARNAVQLGIDHVNANGGFNGAKVELIAYDTAGSPEEAVKIVTKLLTVDKVDSIIGSVNSSEVLAAAGFANDAKVLTFGLGTSATWMQKDWPYVFRATMNNGFAAPITADIVKKVGTKSIAIFKGQDDASLSTAKTFAEACKERGIEVLADESYDVGETDYSAQITKMINSKAEAMYISVIGETGPIIVKQLRQKGYNGLIYDKESFMASQIAIAGEEASNYILFANPYVTYATVEDCDIPNMKSFLELYKSKYNTMVKTDSAYRGWDTMMAMWEASKIAKSNESEAMRLAIPSIKGLAGLGGTLDYTKGNREGYQTFNGFILVNGKNVLIDKWLSGGGFEAYKTATGRSY
ncbi:MAG: ABC transporter substrate-binding protein [Saccharofermentanales bacterium]